MLAFIIINIAAFSIGYKLASKPKKDKETKRYPNRFGPVLSTIPNYKQMTLFKKESVCSTRGQPITLTTVGPNGIVVQARIDSVDRSVLWPTFLNEKTNLVSVVDLSWNEVIEKLPDLAHEVRYFGNEDYRKWWDEEQALKGEFGTTFGDK